MKRIAAVISAALMTVTASNAGLAVFNWGNSDNLDLNAGLTLIFQQNWVVRLFVDAGADSVLNSATGYDAVNNRFIGNGFATDFLVSGITETIDAYPGPEASFATEGSQDWGTTLFNAAVYTVVFNTIDPTLAGATYAIILDSQVFTCAPSSDGGSNGGPMDYIVSTPNGANNNWVPVPEPATMSLVGIGALVIGVRRAMKKGTAK